MHPCEFVTDAYFYLSRKLGPTVDPETCSPRILIIVGTVCVNAAQLLPNKS